MQLNDSLKPKLLLIIIKITLKQTPIYGLIYMCKLGP